MNLGKYDCVVTYSTTPQQLAAAPGAQHSILTLNDSLKDPADSFSKKQTISSEEKESEGRKTMRNA